MSETDARHRPRRGLQHSGGQRPRARPDGGLSPRHFTGICDRKTSRVSPFCFLPARRLSTCLSAASPTPAAPRALMTLSRRHLSPPGSLCRGRHDLLAATVWNLRGINAAAAQIAVEPRSPIPPTASETPRAGLRVSLRRQRREQHGHPPGRRDVCDLRGGARRPGPVEELAVADHSARRRRSGLRVSSQRAGAAGALYNDRKLARVPRQRRHARRPDRPATNTFPGIGAAAAAAFFARRPAVQWQTSWPDQPAQHRLGRAPRRSVISFNGATRSRCPSRWRARTVSGRPDKCLPIPGARPTAPWASEHDRRL